MSFLFSTHKGSKQNIQNSTLAAHKKTQKNPIQSSLGYQKSQEQVYTMFWESQTLDCRAECLQIDGGRKKTFSNKRREGDERKEPAPLDKDK